MLGTKAIWIEAIRILPEGRVPLDEVGWNINFGSGGNEIVTEVVVFQRLARHQPAGWIQAQRLFDDLPRIGESRQIVKLRGLAPEEVVEFVRQLLLDVGVLGNQIPGPVQDAGSGFVSGDNEGHDLVDQLAIRHRLAAVLSRVSMSMPRMSVNVACSFRLRSATCRMIFPKDLNAPANSMLRADSSERRLKCELTCS